LRAPSRHSYLINRTAIMRFGNFSCPVQHRLVRNMPTLAQEAIVSAACGIICDRRAMSQKTSTTPANRTRNRL
jgi:hypothetical protein